MPECEGDFGKKFRGPAAHCRCGRGGKAYGERCFVGSYHCFSVPR